MNKLKQKIKAFSAFLLVLTFFLGWNPAFAESAKNDDTQRAPKSLNLSGLYFGFTPCADCQGVKSTLALNANSTYVLITQYAGKSDREFVEKGKFSMGENGNILILTPRKGGTTIQQYLIDDNMLVKLDEDGNRITKDGADSHILRRKDIMKTPVDPHAGH